MAYTLEIGISKTLGNRPNFRSAEIGNSTSSHWRPVLEALGLDDAGNGDGDWTPVDSLRFRSLNAPNLAFEGLCEEAVEELQALQSFANDERASIQVFARLG